MFGVGRVWVRRRRSTSTSGSTSGSTSIANAESEKNPRKSETAKRRRDRGRDRVSGNERTGYAHVDAVADVTLVSRGRDHAVGGVGAVDCAWLSGLAQFNLINSFFGTTFGIRRQTRGIFPANSSRAGVSMMRQLSQATP